MVTKSEVKGSRLRTTRTCDVQMRDQSFQIAETLVKLDDSQKSLTISIDNGPPMMKDLKINFLVLGNHDPSELQVSAESEQNQENTKMIEGMVK